MKRASDNASALRASQPVERTERVRQPLGGSSAVVTVACLIEKTRSVVAESRARPGSISADLNDNDLNPAGPTVSLASDSDAHHEHDNDGFESPALDALPAHLIADLSTRQLHLSPALSRPADSDQSEPNAPRSIVPLHSFPFHAVYAPVEHSAEELFQEVIAPCIPALVSGRSMSVITSELHTSNDLPSLASSANGNSLPGMLCRALLQVLARIKESLPAKSSSSKQKQAAASNVTYRLSAACIPISSSNQEAASGMADPFRDVTSFEDFGKIVRAGLSSYSKTTSPRASQAKTSPRDRSADILHYVISLRVTADRTDAAAAANGKQASGSRPAGYANFSYVAHKDSLARAVHSPDDEAEIRELAQMVAQKAQGAPNALLVQPTTGLLARYALGPESKNLDKIVLVTRVAPNDGARYDDVLRLLLWADVYRSVQISTIQASAMLQVDTDENQQSDSDVIKTAAVEDRPRSDVLGDRHAHAPSGRTTQLNAAQIGFTNRSMESEQKTLSPDVRSRSKVDPRIPHLQLDRLQTQTDRSVRQGRPMSERTRGTPRSALKTPAPEPVKLTSDRHKNCFVPAGNSPRKGPSTFGLAPRFPEPKGSLSPRSATGGSSYAAAASARPLRMRKKLAPDKWSAGFDEIASKYARNKAAAMDLKERRAIEHISQLYADFDGVTGGDDGDGGKLDSSAKDKPTNFVDFIDYSVGEDLDEFTDLRYTPVFSEAPNFFKSDGYSMWCQEKGRSIELIIVVTVYNEDNLELEATLRGLAANVEALEQQYGLQFWQQVLVCIVADGRSKVSPSLLRYASTIGIFDQELLDSSPYRNGNDPNYVGSDENGHDRVRLHMFEHTMRFHKDENYDYYYPPLQCVFAVKECNAGKLDSHLWFFSAFCDATQPKFCGMVDVGTMPDREGFLLLYERMRYNPEVGGCCGEIRVRNPAKNFWTMAQQFEYIVANQLDKAVESLLGYVTVLPGAFSAYRYDAIKVERGEGPLAAYFASFNTPAFQLGGLRANMYLAEDRILCFELVATSRKRNWTKNWDGDVDEAETDIALRQMEQGAAPGPSEPVKTVAESPELKKDAGYILEFVRGSYAETDCPEDLTSLLAQRRRWMNGAFFALLYSLQNFRSVLTNGSHSILRRGLFFVEGVYLMIQLLFSWFYMGNMYLFIHLALDYLFDGAANIALKVTLWAMLLALLIYSLGHTVQATKGFFKTISSVFILYMIMALSGLVYFLIIESNSVQSRVLSFVMLAIYCSVAAMNRNFLQVLVFFVPYALALPVMVIVFGIYSFCNMHDVSWGTKNITTTHLTTSKGDAVFNLERRTVQERKKVGTNAGQSRDAYGRPIVNRSKTEENVSLSTSKKDEARISRDMALTPERLKTVEAEFRAFRSNFLLLWLFTNIALVQLVLQGGINDSYLVALLVFALFYSGGRGLLAVVYTVLQIFRQWRVVKQRQLQKRSARRLSRSSESGQPVGAAGGAHTRLVSISGSATPSHSGSPEPSSAFKHGSGSASPVRAVGFSAAPWQPQDRPSVSTSLEGPTLSSAVLLHTN